MNSLTTLMLISSQSLSKFITYLTKNTFFKSHFIITIIVFFSTVDLLPYYFQCPKLAECKHIDS